MVRYFHIDVLIVDERFSLMVACGCEEKDGMPFNRCFWILIVKHS